LQKGFFDAIER